MVVNIDNPLLRADFERLCQAKANNRSVPLEVLTGMAETIAAVKGCLQPQYVLSLENKVEKLSFALGDGETLLKTPMPTGFTRHCSRLLFLWSNALPFAFYPVLGPFGTLPTSLLTTYAVLGIEDISVQLEEPFDILLLRLRGRAFSGRVAPVRRRPGRRSRQGSIAR